MASRSDSMVVEAACALPVVQAGMCMQTIMIASPESLHSKSHCIVHLPLLLHSMSAAIDAMVSSAKHKGANL